jgi:hypothetical protein
MPFSRRYTLEEVKGMLQIYRGNHAITGHVPGTNQLTRSPAGAHAHIHGGANILEMKARVNTPGEPRSTGTYWTEDDQAAATLEILNSFQGQIALRRLDIGEKEATMSSTLTPNRYRVSNAHDKSDKGAGVAGHLGRNQAARANAGATFESSYATQGFVKVVKGVGGLMQIQTSYPSATT